MLIPSFTASTIRSTANNFLISSPGENKGGSGKLCMGSSFSGIRGHNMHHKVKTFCMKKGSLHSFEKINLTSLFYRAKPFGKGISSRSVPVGKRLDSNLFCAALRRRKKKTRKNVFQIFFLRSFLHSENPCYRHRKACLPRTEFADWFTNRHALHPV